MIRLFHVGTIGATLLASAAAMPAQALDFNLLNTGGAEQGTAARKGFDIAAAYWSSVLTDNVTVNLQIGFKGLGPGILGSTGSTSSSLLAGHAYSALSNDAKSSLDNIAVAHLKPLTASTTFPGLLALDAITSAYQDPATKTGIDTTRTILDNDGSANNIVLAANTATMKALGITTDDNGVSTEGRVDGSVTFSSDFKFDFNPVNGISTGAFDFIGVAIHEIGHALGFVSGVDTYDLLGGPGSPDYGPPFGPGVTYADLFNAGLFGGAGNIGNFSVFTPLDLFRYSADGLDLSVGADSFFSIDGVNQLNGGSSFSTGSFNGDGQQASHWKDASGCGAQLGIMDPTFCFSQPGVVTGLDLAAFDAIGYDVSSSLTDAGYSYTTSQAYLAFVPEPATWGLMIGGFGMVGGALRRQRFATV